MIHSLTPGVVDRCNSSRVNPITAADERLSNDEVQRLQAKLKEVEIKLKRGKEAETELEAKLREMEENSITVDKVQDDEKDMMLQVKLKEAEHQAAQALLVSESKVEQAEDKLRKADNAAEEKMRKTKLEVEGRLRKADEAVEEKMRKADEAVEEALKKADEAAKEMALGQPSPSSPQQAEDCRGSVGAADKNEMFDASEKSKRDATPNSNRNTPESPVPLPTLADHAGGLEPESPLATQIVASPIGDGGCYMLPAVQFEQLQAELEAGELTPLVAMLEHAVQVDQSLEVAETQINVQKLQANLKRMKVKLEKGKLTRAELQTKLQEAREEKLAEFEETTSRVNELEAKLKEAEVKEASDEMPSTPPGMANSCQISENMRRRQKKEPVRWTLTMQAWFTAMEHSVTVPACEELQRQKRCADLLWLHIGGSDLVLSGSSQCTMSIHCV